VQRISSIPSWAIKGHVRHCKSQEAKIRSVKSSRLISAATFACVSKRRVIKFGPKAIVFHVNVGTQVAYVSREFRLRTVTVVLLLSPVSVSCAKQSFNLFNILIFFCFHCWFSYLVIICVFYFLSDSIVVL